MVAIISIKFKPVYTVYLGEEKLGYTNNQSKFEELIKIELFENEKENIAFSDFDLEVKYEIKFAKKSERIDEEKLILALKEKADITYYKYAILIDTEEKEYVKTLEEAQSIVKATKEQLGDKASVSISTVYTKNLEIENTVEVDTLANDIVNMVKEEEKKEASIINGIYLGVTPVIGNISSRYGAKESIRNHTHQGLDIAAKTGTQIKAVADGKIKKSGVYGGYGNLIIIDHGNGVETYYGHCSKLYVKTGEFVKAGDVIAAVGSTGNSTGPHLHLEIRLNGKYVNPMKYLYN